MQIAVLLRLIVIGTFLGTILGTHEYKTALLGTKSDNNFVIITNKQYTKLCKRTKKDGIRGAWGGW